MDIVVSNILLTRRCEFKCDYCRISKSYKNSPYPKVDSYKELSASSWIEAMKILESKGCIFHILYGGEPVLYKDLEQLVKSMNDREKYYTFITTGVHPNRWVDINKKSKLSGISSSVDVCEVTKMSYNRYGKSCIGRKFLDVMKLSGVRDVVAVTVLDSWNIYSEDLFKLIQNFSKDGIVTEITLMDEPHSVWYDFAGSTGKMLVYNARLIYVMDKLIEMKKEGYLIHNNVEFFNQVKYVVKFGYKCGTPWSSMTLEPDGTIRLCYRIGGRRIRKYKVFDIPKKEEEIMVAYLKDKKELCEGCTWNCQMMSEYLSDKKGYKENVFRHDQ